MITVPGHATKIHPKAVCLVEQAEHYNLPQGIVVNRCVATVKSRSVPVILINTTKQNVWLQQPLLAGELYTAEYHPVEHQADIEVEGDVANVSFLPVVPYTIKVQVEQVESTSTDTSTPTLRKNQYLVLDLILKLQILTLRQRSNACLLN